MKLVRFCYSNSIYKGFLSGDEVVVDIPGKGDERIKFSNVTLLAPVEPSKIVSVGLNYKDHAE
ncbi:MAG: DUF2437 domain-containing protein, partial [Candidatus Omnitrophota bacterium]